MTQKKRHNQREPASSAGQSGSEQGLTRDPIADSESVEELLEEGNSFEAVPLSSVWRTPKILVFPK